MIATKMDKRSLNIQVVTTVIKRGTRSLQVELTNRRRRIRMILHRL